MLERESERMLRGKGRGSLLERSLLERFPGEFRARAKREQERLSGSSVSQELPGIQTYLQG